jgi:hypothetical protein
MRPSPTESATLFKPGYIETGNDGNDYVVVDYNGIKKWKKYNFNEIATKKDISIALKSLSAKHRKIFDLFDDLKKDVEKLGIQFILTGFNYSFREEKYYEEIEKKPEYVLVMFSFLKDYKGNVEFLIDYDIDVEYNVAPTSHQIGNLNKLSKRDGSVKDLLHKYFKNHYYRIEDTSALITFDKTKPFDPEIIMLEIEIYFKKSKLEDFDIDKKRIVSHALDYSEITLYYELKTVEAAKKIALKYFNQFNKNKKVSFSIYCRKNDETIVEFVSNFKVQYKKDAIKWLTSE